jgi:hypothetical protein
VRTVTTEQGDRRVGADIAKTAIAELHRRRRQAWLDTEAAMNEARLARRQGNTTATPWFIAAVREDVAAIANRASSGGRLQPIGTILKATAPTPHATSPAPMPDAIATPLETLCAAEALAPYAASLRQAVEQLHHHGPHANLPGLLTYLVASIGDGMTEPLALVSKTLAVTLAHAPNPEPPAAAPSSPSKALAGAVASCPA